MGKRFNKRYPKSGRINFDGGLNNKFHVTSIQDNESPDCLNVEIDEFSIGTRGGTTRITSAAVGSFVCDGLYTRHDNEGAQTMVAWFNGTLFDWTGSTFTTVPSAQSIYTAGERVFAAEYENYMFFCNTYGTPYKYGGDSDTFTRHGVPQPGSAPVAATAPTGTNLTGDYQYKVSFVNSNLVEGDVSVAGSTHTASSEDIRLTSIAVAPQSHGVNARNIYRTEAGGTTFKRVATINDNTTTTYDDGVTDSNLGVEAPSDNGEPPSYSSVIYHQGRLFVIDPDTNLVKYSEIGNPYVFKATSFLRVGDNTFDLPIGLDIYDNSLVVLCRQNPWIVYMPSTTDTDWAVLRVRANYGCRSPLGSFKYDNKVMYPAVQNDKFVGFAALEGQTVAANASLLTSTALGSVMQSEKIEPDIFDIQESELSNVVSFVYKNKAYITATKGSGNTANNRIYLFDFSLGRLTKKSGVFSWIPWSGIDANDLTILDGTLYCGTSLADGFINEMNTSTYNDNGSAIDSYMWSKEFSGLPGEENLHKDFRFANIFYENVGSYDMDFTIRVDTGSGSGFTNQITLDPGGSQWGSLVWGTDVWDPGNASGEIKYSLGTYSGKRIQFRFSNQNTANQRFKVHGLNFLYNTKGLR